jgi:hypothetical protein
MGRSTTERNRTAMRLAMKAHCSQRTALRWMDGEGVSAMAEQALIWAAEKLGIEIKDEQETEET